MSEQSAKNPRTRYLRPFKPGQSGNPHGRPPGVTSLTSTLKNLLQREITLKADPITGEQNKKVSVRDMLILSLLKKASQGSEKAIELIFDRVDGKVPLKLDGESKPNSNVSLMINFFKIVEMLGKDDAIRDRLSQALESPEALQVRESIQDQDKGSETNQP